MCDMTKTFHSKEPVIFILKNPQPRHLSFTAGKKSNNSSAASKIHHIWTEKDCCETVKPAAKCLFSLARLKDETAFVQNQNKVGVFHMS